MTVTHKERMRRALNHEPVDRIPTQINYTQAMGRRMAARLGVTSEQLPQRLDNHLLRVDINHEHRRTEGGRIAFDWWGVGFDTQQEGYFVAVHPLAGSKDLDTFGWPDPHAPGLLDGASRPSRRERTPGQQSQQGESGALDRAGQPCYTTKA